jgi:uncharacterized protein (TIGR02246 family)
MSQDEQQIRELITTWLRVSAAGDFEAFEKLMAEDVVYLLPGRPPMIGREAFMAASKAGAGQYRMEAVSEVKEIHVSGEFAWCWTHLTVTITPLKGGNEVRRSGNTLSILRREPDGRWVIFRDANLLAVEAENKA